MKKKLILGLLAVLLLLLMTIGCTNPMTASSTRKVFWVLALCTRSGYLRAGRADTGGL
jgi:hypothetical protein